MPGLLLAAHYDGLAWLLLDVNRRRTSFLARAVAQLGWGPRVQVHHGAAEEAARRPEFRAQFSTVVARSFAVPAVTAECAAPFLRLAGRLAVAEPPEPASGRWDVPALSGLGLAPVESAAGPIAVFEQMQLAPISVPRPWREMERRPHW